MYIEIYKKTLNESFNGNIQKCIDDGYFFEWTANRIKNTFNFGKGTIRNLKEYMQNNKRYCIFLQV